MARSRLAVVLAVQSRLVVRSRRLPRRALAARSLLRVIKLRSSGATIDASGAAGGGSVKIGGDWHGEGDLQTASTSTVDENTTISADATVDGDGGDIVVWSDDLTSFGGTISALGAGSGDGGDAEVSGKAVLDYQGFADLGSENGGYGTLLLDPYNITITDDASAGSSFTASEDDSTLLVDTLESRAFLCQCRCKHWL